MAYDDLNQDVRDWPQACLSFLPVHTGDGYSWGGEPVVTIGAAAIQFGEGLLQEDVAREIVRRWNEAARLPASDEE